MKNAILNVILLLSSISANAIETVQISRAELRTHLSEASALSQQSCADKSIMDQVGADFDEANRTVLIQMLREMHGQICDMSRTVAPMLQYILSDANIAQIKMENRSGGIGNLVVNQYYVDAMFEFRKLSRNLNSTLDKSLNKVSPKLMADLTRFGSMTSTMIENMGHEMNKMRQEFSKVNVELKD